VCYSEQIFHAYDTETEELALSVVTVMLRTLYSDDASATSLDGIIVPILNSCLVDLETPDTKDGKAATKSLSAAASASGCLAQYVCERAVPPLVRLATDLDEVSRRPAVFSALCSLLRAYRLGCAPRTEPAALAPLKDELLSILSSGTSNAATLPAATMAILQLPQIDGLLDSAELAYALEVASALALTDETQVDATDVDAGISEIAAVGKRFPEPFERTTLALLFDRLPEGSPPQTEGGEDEEGSCRRALGALSRLASSETALIGPIAWRLLDRLWRAVDERSERGAQYCHYLLATLKAVVKGREGRREGAEEQWGEEGIRLVARLMAILVASVPLQLKSAEAGASWVSAAATRLVFDAAGVVGIVIQRMGVE
jgi:hypothetical protein